MLRNCLLLAALFSVRALGGTPDPLVDFDKTVQRVNGHFYDPTFRGMDWPGQVQHYRSRITATTSDLQLQTLLNELLEKLKASHTEFLSSSDQEYWALKSIFSGRIDGAPTPQVGAWFTRIEGKWFVQNVFNGGPAAAAGVLPGDEILRADGKEFSPVDSFSGKSILTLSIRKALNRSAVPVKIKPVRESFQRSLLRASTKSFRISRCGGKRVAYFHLWSGTHDRFKDSLRVAAREAAEKSDLLILDLRDGFGGASPDYLEPFFPGPDGGQAIYDKPLVVLINDGVRSGKEWITSILKDTHRAKLMGTRTKGYFLAGKPFEIRKGRFMLYLAVGEDPKMPKLEGNGVYPDIEVPINLPYSEGRDPVLASAMGYCGPAFK